MIARVIRALSVHTHTGVVVLGVLFFALGGPSSAIVNLPGASAVARNAHRDAVVPFRVASNAVRGHHRRHRAKRHRAAFEVGIQDDYAFVYQRGISRLHAFEAAQRLVGARLLRINAMWGLVARDGLRPIIETVHAAVASGWKVQITIMGTPSFNPDLDQSLSAVHADPVLMTKFARSVAQALRGQVERYSIWNEPNLPAFLVGGPSVYRALYLAGRAGVRSMDPGAPVMIGELAPWGDALSWLAQVGRVPTEGVSVHPYQGAVAPEIATSQAPSGIGHTATMVKRANAVEHAPLYESEFNYFAANPRQLSLDRRAISQAHRHGARQIVFYQLLRCPGQCSWDTGMINGDPSLPAVTAPLIKPFGGSYVASGVLLGARRTPRR